MTHSSPSPLRTGAGPPLAASPGELPPAGPHLTHEVLNQVAPLTGHDVADDPALLAALDREGASWAAAELHELGRLAGSAATRELARLANENRPVLRSYDSRGNRIDEVEFHPAWHALMETAVRHGLHAAPWADAAPGSQWPGRRSSTYGRRPRPAMAARSR